MNKACQKARGEHEHLIKTQQKLNEDLILVTDWLRKLIEDLSQPFDLSLSLNSVIDLQDSLAVCFLISFKYDIYDVLL